MKKLSFILLLSAFAACGGNGGVEAIGDSQATKMDTLSSNPATMPVDTLGAASMNADTTGMGNAR